MFSLNNINNYKYISILIVSLLCFYKGIFRDDALIIGNHSIHNYAPWQSDEYHQVDEYNYEIVVDKKYLPKRILNLFDREPIKLAPWDPMGALAL